jgi:hypothetical protein
VLYLAVILATFGIGAMTARVAGNRGRVAWRWVVLTIVAAMIGSLGWLFIPPSWGYEGGALILRIAAQLVGPVAGAGVVLLLVWRLPETLPPLRGVRWPMLRLSTRTEPAGECAVTVDGGVLLVGDLRIAAGELTELAVDGECLRITGAGRTLTLMPTGKTRSAGENAKHCHALVHCIRHRLA